MPCHCAKLVDGICLQYGKEPPQGFDKKCKYVDPLPEPEQPPGRDCKQCHRYDQYDTGEWCLFSEDDKEYVFRPAHLAKIDCPLENK
jgi:hypothetical protein